MLMKNQQKNCDNLRSENSEKKEKKKHAGDMTDR